MKDLRKQLVFGRLVVVFVDDECWMTVKDPYYIKYKVNFIIRKFNLTLFGITI